MNENHEILSSLSVEFDPEYILKAKSHSICICQRIKTIIITTLKRYQKKQPKNSVDTLH